MVTDTKDLANKEEPIYVLMAVVLAFVVPQLRWIPSLPWFSSFCRSAWRSCTTRTTCSSQISYITKALSAVLQLGVTMDYSIFLWHSFKEHEQEFPDDKNRRWYLAITNTFQSVIGSSVTTIAGFVALCFMSFTLYCDIGIVMAKRRSFRVISCVTILPSLIPHGGQTY